MLLDANTTYHHSRYKICDQDLADRVIRRRPPWWVTGFLSGPQSDDVEADQHSTELFLPFDLEFTFSATIYVAMSDALFLPTDNTLTYRQEAHFILDDMISKGNRVASLRKEELARLEALLDEVSTRVRASGLQRLALADEQVPAAILPPTESSRAQRPAENIVVEPTAISDLIPLRDTFSEADHALMESQPHNHPTSIDNDILQIIGISSGDFMSIVDQIDIPYHADDLNMIDTLSQGSIGGVIDISAHLTDTAHSCDSAS